MTIEIQNINNQLELIIDGRLDSSTAGDLEEVINHHLTDETELLTVNMKGIDFISSKGLRVLVAAYKKLDGRKMVLIEPNASVKEVLRLSGLLKIFTLK